MLMSKLGSQGLLVSLLVVGMAACAGKSQPPLGAPPLPSTPLAAAPAPPPAAALAAASAPAPAPKLRALAMSKTNGGLDLYIGDGRSS